jgi:hypothetical protein
VDISTTLDNGLEEGKWYTLLSPLVDSMTAKEPPQIFLKLEWMPNRHLQVNPVTSDISVTAPSAMQSV